jgi:hypothetical protein
MLDLRTWESWRQLSQHESTLPTPETVHAYNGMPFYIKSNQSRIPYLRGGLEVMELSLDGTIMFYSTQTSGKFYSIKSSYLNANPINRSGSTVAADRAVQNLGQKGGKATGFASDNLGMIYMLMPESNAVYIFKSTAKLAETFVRDSRIVYPDRAFSGYDGYLYFIVNQLPYSPAWNEGIGKVPQFPLIFCESYILREEKKYSDGVPSLNRQETVSGFAPTVVDAEQRQ